MLHPLISQTIDQLNDGVLTLTIQPDKDQELFRFELKYTLENPLPLELNQSGVQQQNIALIQSLCNDQHGAFICEQISPTEYVKLFQLI